MKAYVSSTFEDLKEYRKAVYDQLRMLRIDAVAMEDYVASGQRPLRDCIQDIADCQVYIGLFAWRYGFVPREDNPKQLSITELEYLSAREHGKDSLIFLLDENAAWPPRLSDSHTGEGDAGRRMRRFRNDLTERHSVMFFSSPDDLAKRVSASVSKVQLRYESQVRRDSSAASKPSRALTLTS